MTAAALPRARPSHRWASASLWILFAALVSAIWISLLPACSLGWPGGRGGAVGACPRPLDVAPLTRARVTLAGLKSEIATLRLQLVDRAACETPGGRGP